MRDYKWLHEYCLNRFGSVAALESILPQPRTADELRAISDDRYLSVLSLLELLCDLLDCPLHSQTLSG